MANADKLFVVRKWIKAKSAKEAIKKDKTHPVDDVWVDDDWRKAQNVETEGKLGFNKK